jgi:hypothetical protein
MLQHSVVSHADGPLTTVIDTGFLKYLNFISLAKSGSHFGG